MVSVPCNGCVECCRNTRTILDPAVDDVTQYETRPVPPWAHGYKPHALELRRRGNGDCWYLTAALDGKFVTYGCSIPDRKPAMCNAYDCRVWLAAGPAAIRRAIRAGMARQSIIDAAKALRKAGA